MNSCSYFSLLIQYNLNEIIIKMSEDAKIKSQLNFFQLKVQCKEPKLPATAREENIKGSVSSRMTKSLVIPSKVSKYKSNPQEQHKRKTSFNLSNQLGKDLNKITNTIFTLPQIKTSMNDYEHSQIANDLNGYFTARMSISLNQKTNKNISSRYYKQMEAMKEIREPIRTQRVFTIMNIQNGGIQGNNKGVLSNGMQGGKAKKSFFPTSALDKYQINKEKQAVNIPAQLQTKKVAKRILSQELSRDQKKHVKVKPEGIKRNFKVERLSEPPMEVFKLEGWVDDKLGMPLYD